MESGKWKVIKFALLINIFVQIGLKAQRYIQYLTKFKINNKNQIRQQLCYITYFDGSQMTSGWQNDTMEAFIERTYPLNHLKLHKV